MIDPTLHHELSYFETVLFGIVCFLVGYGTAWIVAAWQGETGNCNRR